MSARKTGSDDSRLAPELSSRPETSPPKSPLTRSAEMLVRPRTRPVEDPMFAMDLPILPHPTTPLAPLALHSIPERGLPFIVADDAAEPTPASNLSEVADRGIFFHTPADLPTRSADSESSASPDSSSQSEFPSRNRRARVNAPSVRVDWSALLEALRDRSTRLGEFANTDPQQPPPGSRASA